jgi:hypothetical protein
VPPEVLEKFDDLRAFDAPGMHLEVEPPQCQTTNDRKTFPIEGLVQDGGLSARSPSANPCGPRAQSAFVDKDDGSPLLAGLFLTPAIPPASISGWPARRAQRPDAPDAGN